MNKRVRSIAFGMTTLFGLALVAPAAAQSDWTQYFDYQGITFYYAPSTVTHNGGMTTAKWHDSNHPEIVFLVQIDCSARTIQSMSVDKYDPQSGAFLGSVDLTGQSAPEQIGADYTMAAHLAQVTC
ncbi:MAG: hypothetical protein KGL29_02530 [Alphaproteobacteria bacterium]|nr:hypothetical protein [Alphaproteobacteria bacterium]MDE2163922.1 hypothetical protein [Alphaproteobacteria bacterium]MDE2264751.1 hypothetical protein [Alphaproteobacteria bacterium]MDE2500728.1 hypothetical protein [Alphaproteobacteria bacterium]